MTLMELLNGEGVVGVARLAIAPNFHPAELYTLVYTEPVVTVSAEQGTFLGGAALGLRELRRLRLLAIWQALRAAALAAPSCTTRSVETGTSNRRVELLAVHGYIGFCWLVQQAAK